MKVVIQRVKKASVSIDGEIHSKIEKGLLVLLGITHEDTSSDVDYLVKKTVNLRIFNDEQGVMNLSLKDIDGDILIVSQFTLHAKTKKGNRPSYMDAAGPKVAIPLYQEYINKVSNALSEPAKTGVFGADMQVELQNDGPVTIVIDSILIK